MKFLPFIFLFFSVGLQGQSVDYYVKLVPCEKKKTSKEVEKTNSRTHPMARPRTRSQPKQFDISGYLSKAAHIFSTNYLSSLSKVPRIKLVKESESKKFPITHVLETCASIDLVNDNVAIKRFVDSTKLVYYETMVKVRAETNLLLKEVSTGKIIRSKSFKLFEEEKIPGKLAYKAFNKKGAKPRKRVVIEELRKGYGGMIKKALVKMNKDAQEKGKAAEYDFFPYKLKVIEATEIKKGHAKKLTIEYDSKYGNIRNKYGSIFHTYQTEINGESKTVSARIATGTVGYYNKDKTAFTFIVGFTDSEKAVFKALDEGKELFFSLGSINIDTDKPEKIKIALGNIKAPPYFEPSLEQLYSEIQSQMTERGDLEVLDRKNFEGILKIKENNKNEAFLDEKIAEQFSAAGADYLMEVVFDEPVMTGHMPDDSFMQPWSIKFAYESRLYDVKTGELVFNEPEFSGSSVKVKYTKTPPYKAAGKKAGNVRFEVKEFLDYALPRELTVHKVRSEKKGKAKSLEMYGIFKISKKEKFIVNEVIEREVNGEKLVQHKEIGAISVDGRLNSFIIKASVKKGGKEILKAIQENKKLFFTSRANWIERWDNRVEARQRRRGG